MLIMLPLNTIEDIVTRMHGSQIFSTLDANMGYFQIKLSKKSSILTTFNTLFSRYRYLRMPMGLKCAAEVFQREIINNWWSWSGYGRDEQEHSRLRVVLERVKSINLKLNKSKCILAKHEVNYVGHLLTGEGLKPPNGSKQSQRWESWKIMLSWKRFLGCLGTLRNSFQILVSWMHL